MSQQLFECKLDYNIAVKAGAIFTPFIPTVGSICTLLSIEKCDGEEGYLFEELEVSLNGLKQEFIKQYWKEITNIPSIKEITEMVEEVQINYIPFEV